MYFSEYNDVFPILVFINAIYTEPVLELPEIYLEYTLWKFTKAPVTVTRRPRP